MRLAVLSIIVLFSNAYPAVAQSTCSAEEKIVWSCKNPQSTYAVCASGDLAQTSGYLQYRATKGGKPVLTFPASRTHPAGLFKFSLLARGATLSFENGGYLYKMFEGLQGAPFLVVSKAGNSLSSVQCVNSDYMLTLTKTINLLEAAGIRE